MEKLFVFVFVWYFYILVPNVKQKLLHMSLCQAKSMHNALFPLHYEF